MLQTVVEDTDVYNSLGFATGADCCFLVSSVRIWLESHGKAQLSEWINLKLQHPPGGTGLYLVPGGSGEFDVCLGRVGNLNWKCQLWLDPCKMTTWVNRCNPSCSEMKD